VNATPLHRTTATRVVATLALTLVMLAAGVLTSARPADAWYRANALRRPGPVAVPTPFVVDEYDGFVLHLHWRTHQGPLVYRSPATRGPQTVMAIYTIQDWTPSFGWTNTTRQVTQVYTIPRGQRAVRLPKLDLAPTNTRGYFRVQYAIAWSNARTGASLGGSLIMPNLATDHTCETLSRPCVTGAGFIRTGRLWTHGGGW
jgi:hypothetical protein